MMARSHLKIRYFHTQQLLSLNSTKRPEQKIAELSTLGQIYKHIKLSQKDLLAKVCL